MMTQYDVDKVLLIEKDLKIKMEEIKFNELKVLEEMATITKAIKKIKLVEIILLQLTKKFKEND